MQTGIHHQNQLITSLDEFDFQFGEYSNFLRPDQTVDMLKSQIVMKLKNSNCDETQKNQIVMKLRISNYDEFKNSNCDETQQFKW